jgi:hypothetical protein
MNQPKLLLYAKRTTRTRRRIDEPGEIHQLKQKTMYTAKQCKMQNQVNVGQCICLLRLLD